VMEAMRVYLRSGSVEVVPSTVRGHGDPLFLANQIVGCRTVGDGGCHTAGWAVFESLWLANQEVLTEVVFVGWLCIGRSLYLLGGDNLGGEGGGVPS